MEGIMCVLRSSSSELETYRCCKQLLTMMEESEDSDFLSEAVKVLCEDNNEAFLQICTQVGKLDVLPLIAMFLTECDDDNLENTVKKHPIASPEFVRKLVPLGTNLRDVKHVVVILSFLANRDTITLITAHLPELLNHVKTYWQDEELVHGTVKLVHELLMLAWVEDLDINWMLADGVLTTVSVLLSLLFAKDPATMDLSRRLDFPKYGGQFQPVAYIWLDTLFDEYISEDADTLDMLKVLRPIIPIVSHVLKQISENEEFAREFRIPCVSEILAKIFLSGCKKSLRLLISSGVIVNLLKVCENYPDDLRLKKKFIDEKHVASRMRDALRAIEIFLGLLTKLSFPSTTADKIEMLPTLLAFLKSKRFFEEDLLYLHGQNCKYGSVTDVPFAHYALDMISEFIKEESKSKMFISTICDEIENTISIMIDFAKINEFCLKLVAMDLAFALTDTKSPKILQHVIPILPTCLQQVVHPKLIDRCEEKRLNPHKNSHLVNGLSFATFHIVYQIISIGTLSQVLQLNIQYKLFDAVLKALKLSSNEDILCRIIQTLCTVVNRWGLDVIPADTILQHMPIIWKKMKVSEEVKIAAFELTKKASLVLPVIHELPGLSEIEPYLSDYFYPLKIIPLQAGVLRLAWGMVKCKKHGHLIKVLSKVSSGKTVEYATPENIEIARIFKYLTDTIIEYLEADPPYNVEYLTDLTKCMVGIAKSSSLDEETYVLEGMVSPAMWLLEKQSDDGIVANVKQFIKILH